ncbi:MAG: VCBS repeat-containing protein [Planctomycetia bacterium]|nr:VCBS repeat-containing protein [Planctomycetia bacterium]
MKIPNVAAASLCVLLVLAEPARAGTVIVQPGNESQIAVELNGGNNVELVAGQVYNLSANEAIVINAANVVLDGKGAVLRLDTSFNNYKYNPLIVHGKVHTEPAAPLRDAFGIYIAPSSQNVTIKNLKIDRVSVSGSVVRSIGVVKANGLTIQNVEFTGNTIGPVIDIVDCHHVTVADCNIHDVTAEDGNQTLELQGGKPNLTGILVDDVDLLIPVELRKDAAYHSNDVRILNGLIKNLSMHSSVNDAMNQQLGINDNTQQTDGINVQRGFDYHILNNVIVNVDEGIDTFAFRGVIRDNVIKLSPYKPSSAGIKFVHGASHNLAMGNLIVNRDISTMLESSRVASLTGSQGVYGNVIIYNTSIGSGSHLHRIGAAQNAVSPQRNLMLKNSGGKNSSDIGSGNGNVFYSSASAEPDLVLLANLHLSGAKKDIAAYFRSAGKMDVYFKTTDAGFENYDTDAVADAICRGKPAQCHDWNRNMTHVLCGRFFNHQPQQPDVEFLFMNLSGSAFDRFQRNDGNHRFSQYSYELEAQLLGSGFENALAADFNGDGRTDVLLHSTDDGASRLYRNDDQADTANRLEFSRLSNPIEPSAIRSGSGNSLVALKAGDFNGDGIADLFALWFNGRSTIFQGSSDLRFATRYQLTGDFGAINGMRDPDDVQVYDYNMDGRDDVLFKMGSDLKRLFLSEEDDEGAISFSFRNINF